jgi:pimeloyl-ACP methyl ester carboxylesterase
VETRQHEEFGFTVGHWPLDPLKPTVIFIHGAASGKSFWNHQVDYFSPYLNSIAIDLPGHGDSHGSGKNTISEYAEVVLQFINNVPVPGPIPCGLSMGGAITQHLLVNHSNRFTAGILINTGAKLKVLPVIFETIERNYNEFLKMIFEFVISEKNDTEALRAEIEAGSKCRPETAYGDFWACNHFNVMDELKQIDIPVLVLTASDDKLTPFKYGRFIADNIKASELALIKNAGHFSPIEKPDEVNKAIHKFLLQFTS